MVYSDAQKMKALWSLFFIFKLPVFTRNKVENEFEILDVSVQEMPSLRIMGWGVSGTHDDTLASLAGR